MSPGAYILIGFAKFFGALPRWFLYGPVRWKLYLLLYYVVRYRRRVTRENLTECFPEKPLPEIKRIEKKFYGNLAEVFIDTFDLAGIGKKAFARRITFEGVERHEAENRGRDWIGALAHYGSWEYFTTYGVWTHHTLGGVYKPLKSKTVDDYYKYVRTRFGADVVPKSGVMRYVVEKRRAGKHFILGLISDQTPPRHAIDHWYDFLGRKTAFFNGAEKLALRFGMPVYAVDIKKTARCRYTLSYTMIYDGQELVPEHEITARYARYLEAMIRRDPSLWMWSHKRWKHTPESIGNDFE